MSDRLKQLFGEAAELPADRRASFLDGACGGDEILRVTLDDLLRAHDRAGDFLAHPAALIAEAALDADQTDHADDELEPGQSFHRYRLLERLGRGGSASVWRARQQRPVERDVALKILRTGIANGRAADRFVAECEALARMQHPAIAKVFDAGASADGASWLAMEVVDGVPITRHCEAGALPLSDRLALFAEVCFAVQHAHTKGIVHRDLKPTNVLVAMRDGRPQPVVIDFGIAAALPRGDADGGRTGAGDTFGTPEYMSPEQAELGQHAVDARSDVYSLGVVLYELVCGTPPHTRRHAGGVPELLRRIREQEPVPPSRRSARVPREVDWIVARALAKDPTRRYPTAIALGEDVRRLLRHEVVAAGPGTAWHRFVKFVRRHRYGVGAASATALSLALATAISVDAWLAEKREAANASLAAAKAATAEAAARREASTANRALDLLDELWSGIDPTRVGRRDYAVRELLADFERLLPARTRGEPALELRVRCSLARLHTYLKLPVSAEEHATRAVAVAEQMQAPRELCGALLLRGRARFELGQFAAARADARRARDVATRHADDAGHLAAPTYELEAHCHLRGDDRDGALPLAERALELRRAAGEAPELAASYLLLAEITAPTSHAEAVAFVRRALAALAPLGPDHPDALAALQHLGTLQLREQDTTAAAASFRENLTRRRRVYGEQHLQTAGAKVDLGWALHGEEQFAEAEALLREALPVLRAQLGDEHTRVTDAMQRLGAVLATRGQFAEAEALFAEAVQRCRTLPLHPVEYLTACMGNLARMQAQRGDPHLGRATQAEALAIAERSLPADHFAVCCAATNLADLTLDAGDTIEAVRLLQRELQRSVRTGRHGHAQLQRERLVILLRSLGHHEKAAVLEAEQVRGTALLPAGSTSPPR